MTATEINAEIYRNLGYLADNEDYMQTVLNFLKKLTVKKRNAQAKSVTVKKFKVDMSSRSSLDQFAGILNTTREDDEKAKEEFMKEKYGL